MADRPANPLDALETLRGSRSLVLGIGNRLKGDDAVGPLVCEKVAGRISAKVIDTGTVPENYIGPVAEYAPDHILIVDAVDFGSPAGAIRIFCLSQVDALGFSTHSISPRLVADRMAKEVSGEVYFIGIQPGHIRLGDPVSPEVSGAVETVAHVLLGLFPVRGKNADLR